MGRILQEVAIEELGGDGTVTNKTLDGVGMGDKQYSSEESPRDISRGHQTRGYGSRRGRGPRGYRDFSNNGMFRGTYQGRGRGFYDGFY